MSLYQDQCNVCGTIVDIADPKCDGCYNIIPRPLNYRRADLQEEREALKLRYEEAVELARLEGSTTELDEFELHVKDSGIALINTPIDFLWKWLLENRADYVGYGRQVIENLRPKAIFQNDVQRSSVDSILYGSENDFVYAALATDETGLTSYGEVTIVLKTIAVEKRTVAFEENSFLFIKKLMRNSWVLDERIPAGHFSTWDQKHILAVSKYQNKVKKGTSILDMDKILLDSS